MPRWCLGVNPQPCLCPGRRAVGAFQENVGAPSVVCRLRRACRPLAGRAAVLGCLETGGSASSSLTVLYVGVNQEGFRKKKKKREAK